jgi:hypothetical protein
MKESKITDILTVTVYSFRTGRTTCDKTKNNAQENAEANS